MTKQRNEKLLSALAEGVDVNFLRSFFKISRYKAEKYTRDMHPIGYDQYDNPLYNLTEACWYFTDPKKVLRNSTVELTDKDLPDKLQETYWNAKLKKQKYEEQAGDLWPTKKVRDVLAELMQDFRSRLTLLPDDLDRMIGLSNTQLRNVTGLIDAIQNDIYRDNFETAKKNDFGNELVNETQPTYAEIKL